LLSWPGWLVGAQAKMSRFALTRAGGTPRPSDNDARNMMSMSPGRGSATIHQFPAGGRAGSVRFGAVRDGGEASIARLFPAVAVVEFGSGWYHEAAITQDDADRKH
jgi:hypothetical protein